MFCDLHENGGSVFSVTFLNFYLVYITDNKNTTPPKKTIILKENLNDDDPLRIQDEVNNKIQSSPVLTENKPIETIPIPPEDTDRDPDLDRQDRNLHMITYNLPSFASTEIKRKSTESVQDVDSLLLDLTVQNENETNEEKSYRNTLERIKSSKLIEVFFQFQSFQANYQ